MPTISIIVANYNYAEYIRSALDSVLHQTFSDWECIIVDDGSDDNSVSIVQEYCAKDKRFILIQQKHSGVSVARNAGLDAAKGIFVAFLDADDCYTECTLEMLLHTARMTNSNMVGGQATIVENDFSFIPNKSHSWMVQPFFTQNYYDNVLSFGKSFNYSWIWRRLYARNLIGNTRFLPELTDIGEDICFMLDIMHKSINYTEITNIVCYHRHHKHSIMHQEFRKQHFDFFPLMFLHIKENLLDKYNTGFLQVLYNTNFKYLLLETIIKPRQLKKFQTEAKRILIKSCKLIPFQYLTFRNKILCWFLSKLVIPDERV